MRYGQRPSPSFPTGTDSSSSNEPFGGRSSCSLPRALASSPKRRFTATAFADSSPVLPTVVFTTRRSPCSSVFCEIVMLIVLASATTARHTTTAVIHVLVIRHSLAEGPPKEKRTTSAAARRQLGVETGPEVPQIEADDRARD